MGVVNDEYDTGERHPACTCGCGELADECPNGSWVSRLDAPSRSAARRRERTPSPNSPEGKAFMELVGMTICHHGLSLSPDGKCPSCKREEAKS